MKLCKNCEVTCPHCGATNDKAFAHCTNCGKPLEKQPTQTATASPVAVNLRQEMSDLYDEANASEMSACPECGEMLPLTSIFCHKCGASIAKLTMHKVVKRKVCPHCGQFNANDAIYCSYCFSSLADAESAQLQVVHDVKNLGDGVVKQTMLDDGGGKRKLCPNCGALNAPEETFCVSCGLKLEVDPQKKYCPNCSTENQGDASFCIRCNWSFDGLAPKGPTWECPHCKAQNDHDSAYCTNCGKPRK